MSTRTIRNGMAWVVAGALAAASAPLQAETDPTVARVTPAAAASAAAPVGGEFSPRGRSALFLPGSGLVPPADVPSEHLTADASGPGPVAEAAGPRVRALILGWPVATPTKASATSLRRTHGECGARCAALVSGVGGHGSANAASLKQLVTRVTGGYRLSSTLRVSLSPKVQRVRGQPMTGFSVRIKGV